MPTTKPRITITLSDHQHNVLQALSEVQEVSMSSIVVDLLDTVVPVLERLSIILKSAKEAPASVRADLKKSAEAAEAQFLPIGEDMMGQLDLLISGATGGRREAELAQPTGALKSPKKPRPPTSNRGVSSPQKSSISKASSPMKNKKNTGESRK